MHVRAYRASDAAALLALKRDTIRRVNSRDYTPAQVQAWAPDDDDSSQAAFAAWPQRVAKRFVAVAESQGQPIGFGDVGPDGHIDQFFVHADHQGRGVGRAIFEALFAEARRTGVARLSSEVSITARPFFEARGFQVDAEQVVVVRGVALVNYRMSRPTGDGGAIPYGRADFA